MKHILSIFFVVAVLTGCQSRAQEVEKQATQETVKAQVVDTSTALLAQGRQQLANNNIKEAAAAFRSALEANPKNLAAYLSLSEIFMRLGRFSDAQVVLEQAVANTPEDGSVFYLLSIAYQQQGRIMPAIMAARKSVEIFQRDQDEDNFKQSVALVQSLTKQASQQVQAEAEAVPAPIQPVISPLETAVVIPAVQQQPAAVEPEPKPVVQRKQNFGPR